MAAAVSIEVTSSPCYYEYVENVTLALLMIKIPFSEMLIKISNHSRISLGVILISAKFFTIVNLYLLRNDFSLVCFL